MTFIEKNKRPLAILYVLLVYLILLFFPEKHFYNNSSFLQYFHLLAGLMLPLLLFSYAFNKPMIPFIVLALIGGGYLFYASNKRNQELIKNGVKIETVVTDVDYYTKSRGRRRGRVRKEKAIAIIDVEGVPLKVTKSFDRGKGYEIGDSVLVIYSKKFPKNNRMIGLLP